MKRPLVIMLILMLFVEIADKQLAQALTQTKDENEILLSEQTLGLSIVHNFNLATLSTTQIIPPLDVPLMCDLPTIVVLPIDDFVDPELFGILQLCLDSCRRTVFSQVDSLKTISKLLY
jgi:hypothetical protein